MTETPEDVARDLTSLLAANTLATQRLADRRASVPDTAMLHVRLNLLVESAFGSIDYKALTDPERTDPERLIFERRFQQARRMLLTDGQRQVDEQGGGIVAPVSRLHLPGN